VCLNPKGKQLDLQSWYTTRPQYASTEFKMSKVTELGAGVGLKIDMTIHFASYTYADRCIQATSEHSHRYTECRTCPCLGHHSQMRNCQHTLYITITKHANSQSMRKITDIQCIHSTACYYYTNKYKKIT